MNGDSHCVADVFLFYVGLVVHDFEEDLEFGEFAFVLQKKVLVFSGKLFNLTLTLVKRKLISIRLDESSNEERGNMHIADGILTPEWCIIWYSTSRSFRSVGARQIAAKRKINPSYMSLVGLMGAAVFVISVWHIPVPVTGSCSHPVGTPMAAMIIGPGPTIVISAIALFFQTFIGHGGITAIGANDILNGNRWNTHRIRNILGIKKSRRLNLAFSRHRRSSWRFNDVHNSSL